MPQVAMVASAVAGVASIGQQIKAGETARKQSELQNKRSQRQAFREAQIRRAQSLASSVAGGSSFGSGIAGGMSSLNSQLGETMGYSSQMSGLNKQISMAEQRASFFKAASEFNFAGLSSLFPKQTNPTMTSPNSGRI